VLIVEVCLLLALGDTQRITCAPTTTAATENVRCLRTPGNEETSRGRERGNVLTAGDGE
jgi:hypothetical protein